MHVVLIAWGMPPSRGPGVYRPLAMVRLLTEMGHQVSVLTTSRETFTVLYGGDQSLESSIPESVNIVRVPFSPDQLWPIVNDWPRLRVSDPKRWARLVRGWDFEVYPESTYPSWLPAAERALLDLHRNSPIDLTVATGNPYVDFDLAFRLYEHFAVPFVLDDRDSFLFDVYTGGLLPEYEQRLPLFTTYLEAAIEYWCVNPGIADLHRGVAGPNASRINVLRNGWDAGAAPSSAARIRPRPPGQAINIGYVGTVYPRTPLDEVLEAWSEFRLSSATPAELRFIGSIGFTSDSPGRSDQPKRKIESTPGASLLGRVEKASIGSVYRQLDALLFTAPGGSLVTSGKVYEYMSTGLPIAALGAPDLDALTILRDYPRAHLGTLGDISGSAQALRNAVDDALHTDANRLSSALRAADNYRRETLMRPALTRVMKALQ